MRLHATSALLLLTLAATACSAGDGRAAEAERRSAEVFMTVDATPRQVDAVREHLRRADGVRIVEYLDKDDAYAEFERLFADDPDLVASVQPESLPASFRIEVDAGELGALRRDIEALAGVDVVKTPATPAEARRLEQEAEQARRCGRNAPLEVFMTVDATGEEIEAVRATLEADPAVAQFRFLDAQAAYERFRCMVPDQADEVGPNALPSSFEVVPRPDTDLEALTARLEVAPGVDVVSDYPWAMAAPGSTA